MRLKERERENEQETECNETGIDPQKEGNSMDELFGGMKRGQNGNLKGEDLRERGSANMVNEGMPFRIGVALKSKTIKHHTESVMP